MPDRRLGHCKLCELGDFADPELRELIREAYEADLEHFGDPDFPTGREYRKYWEMAMTLRTFRNLGVFREDARVLGVGQGVEEMFRCCGPAACSRCRRSFGSRATGSAIRGCCGDEPELRSLLLTASGGIRPRRST